MLYYIDLTILLLSTILIVIYLVPSRYQRLYFAITLFGILCACVLLIYIDYIGLDNVLRRAGRSIEFLLKQPLKWQISTISIFISGFKFLQCALIVTLLSPVLLGLSLFYFHLFDLKKFPLITFILVEAILIKTLAYIAEYIVTGQCICSLTSFYGLLSSLVLVLLVVFIKYLWDNKDKNGLF